MFQALLLASPSSLDGSVRKVSNGVLCVQLLVCRYVRVRRRVCAHVLMCMYAEVNCGYYSSGAFNLDFFFF